MFTSSARFTLPLLAALLLAGCGSTPQKAVSRGHAPDIVDQRAAPQELAKVTEADGVRMFVGEDFFGTSLFDVFHREVLLSSPRFPEPTILAVTGLEVSVHVPSTGQLLDPSRVLSSGGRYRPAPGALVLDERTNRADQVVRVEIGCEHGGRMHQVVLTDTTTADEVRQRAALLYSKAIAELLAKLSASS